MSDDSTPTLRRLLATYLLVAGVGFVLLSAALSSDAGSTLAVTKIVAWALGAAALLMGLGVWLFGKLNLLWLITIDLRDGKTTFVVGVPFCSVRLTDTWQSGAFQVSGQHGVFLVVPTLARLIALLVIGSLLQQLLAKWMGAWWALCAALLLMLGLWSAQRRIPSAAAPGDES